MSYPRLIGIVKLKRWMIEEQGFASPPFVFDFDISWPRPTVSNSRRELIVGEEAGQEVDWSGRSFREKLIFKEILEGPISLGVSVYPADIGVAEKLSDLVSRLGAEMASNFINLRFSTLNRIADIVQETGVGGFVESLEKSIAAGSTRLELEAPRGKFDLRLPLRAPENIENPAPERRRVREKEPDLLKQPGEENGFVELEIELMDR